MNDWDLSTWLMIDGGTAAVVVFALVFLSGCGGLSDPEAVAVAEHIGREVPSVGSLTSLPQDELGAVAVYVDRSLSMQAFTEARSSDYFDVLRELDGLLAGNIQFYGFGFPSQESGQITKSVNPVLLEEASAYTYVNNDYGALFANLIPENGRTHLVISDGVQSDVDGPRFGDIVSSIGAWIDQGGVFSLMAYRAPYRGRYYHEVPTTGRVQYDCPDRPFYIFGFFPSASAQEEALDILDGGDVTPEHVITIGRSSASVVVQEEGLPDPGQRRGPKVLATYADHSGASPHFNHVYSGRPTQSAMPLHFEVRFDSTAPWTSLSDDEQGAVSRALDPSFQHWRIDTLEVEPTNVSLTPTEAPRVLGATSEADADRPLTGHLVTPMTYTPEASRASLASVITVGLSASGANRLIPDALSTRRDDQPAACNRTLNIQRTLGAVLREHYVLGRALLITQWTSPS